MGPTSDATPLVRLTVYSEVVPPTVSTACRYQGKGRLPSREGASGAMSKPFAAVKSKGLPLSVTTTGSVAVPPLGGFWM